MTAAPTTPAWIVDNILRGVANHHTPTGYAYLYVDAAGVLQGMRTKGLMVHHRVGIRNHHAALVAAFKEQRHTNPLILEHRLLRATDDVEALFAREGYTAVFWLLFNQYETLRREYCALCDRLAA